MKRHYLIPFTLILLLVVAFDHLTKWWALSIDTIPLVGDWLRFQYAENTGIAFSLPLEGLLLQVVTAVFIVLIFLYYLKDRLHYHLFYTICFAFILGGAVGNAIDRFFRGFVVDFIAVGNFPIFNVADSFVTTGVALLLVGETWKHYQNKKRSKNNDRVEKKSG